MQQTIRLVVEYDGTPYAGWQAQRNRPSIEQCLTEALQRLLRGASPRLTCAGRTDAGVHAYGQVVSLVTASPVEARRFTPALNHFLPDSIRVHHSDRVPDDFDARFCAQSKRYRYRLYVGPQRLAIDRRRAWHVPTRLDVAAMRAAAAQLVGSHDFEAFRSAHCDAAHARRTMYQVGLTEQPRPPAGQFIDLTFHANAFCRHMCRILAGTLVEVGRRRLDGGALQALLQGGRRQGAGMTAPPWGLTLLEVIYPARFAP